jgi:DNA-directed RNA polymerase specialized sigma24 family protein
MAVDRDFTAFYEANYERLVVQLFAVTGNLQDAQDVVQEAFARACVRWQRLHAYDLPAAWVRRVAIHLALQGLRRARRTLGLRGRSGPPREPPTSDDELRRRFSQLQATLLPQVRGADLAAVQRRGRARRTHRALAVAAAATLLVVAAVAGAKLHPFAHRGVVGPVSPSVPSTAPPLPRGPQRVVGTDRGLAGIAVFGDPMDPVLAALRERLGPPDEEVTNQNNPEGNIFGVCPGAQVGNRYVRWGRLWVLFTNGQSSYGHGPWHLFAY